jgi:hypothetical protein
MCTLLAAACAGGGDVDPRPVEGADAGVRTPGYKPGERLMLYMTTTDLSLESCSNEPGWVANFESFQELLSPGPVAYGISDSGRQADLLSCTTPGDPGTCSNKSPRVTFEVVEGTKLVQQVRTVVPSDDWACAAVYDTTITVEDHGTTFTETVVQDLTLEGDGASCAEMDQAFKDLGTNGYGIQGCRATFISDGELR